jgi:glutamate dehydrogenase
MAQRLLVTVGQQAQRRSGQRTAPKRDPRFDVSCIVSQSSSPPSTDSLRPSISPIPSMVEMLKIDLVDQLEYLARIGREPEVAERLIEFMRALYVHVPPSDLVAERPEALVAAAEHLLAFAEQRKPRNAKIRVFNPTREAHGWTSRHTVLEVVNDDMPFLVDSLTGALGRLGAELRLVIHPILRVTRDAAGKLLSFEDGSKREGNESIIHIRVPPVPVERHGELIERIESVLADVRAAVEDFEPMRERCAAEVTTLHAPSPLFKSEHLGEVRAFLNWLKEGNFIFLGYAYCRFSGSLRKSTSSGPDSVRFVRDPGLGLLRDPGRSMFDVFEPPREHELCRVLKANRRSTVHRTTHMDSVLVSDHDASGGLRGVHMFVGLFSLGAYSSNPKEIPLLHHKIQRVMARAGFSPHSHDGKTLRYILETYPRDELFQISERDLYSIALGILHLQNRQRVALFVRRDTLGRFVSCLVFLPRDRMDTWLRLRVQKILADAFEGVVTAFYPQLGEQAMGRLHLIIKTPAGAPEQIDYAALERKLEQASLSWDERLLAAALSELGEERGHQLLRRYAAAFPASYREDFDEITALEDIEYIDGALESGRLSLHLYKAPESKPHELKFKVFSPKSYLEPSDVLPMLENLGLHVVGERPYEIQPQDVKDPVWMHEFSLVMEGEVAVDDAEVKDDFREVFSSVWEGKIDDDGMNKLVLHARLSGRQVLLLRAYAKYLRQLGVPFSEGYMQNTLKQNAGIARALVELFLVRFDPDRADDERAQKLNEQILAGLEAVSSLDEDRILRRFLNLVLATTRTNFFQLDASGAPKDHVSFKFESALLEELPAPVPFREIFVSGPRVEGVHLRFGEVARGGLRWSDRQEDFRTEVLGLVKAQQVKNAVIVPVGSKGGFVVRRSPPASDRAAVRAEGVECYKIFVTSLLELTDNRKPAQNGAGTNGARQDVIVRPPRTRCYDPVDPYLVVAADKGTATFSDIANEISTKHGFWLDDAFASGGSAGYDHKAMGITAKGTWESVKRAFRELGKDIQQEDFTAVGVGDMSGDVFGNGMLLSSHTLLVAAFDHRHIFLDPKPDALRSKLERQRLFELPQSSWNDYDKSLISKGGGVYPRTQKRIDITPEVAEVLDITLNPKQPWLSPNQLISAMLKAPVELLFFGGIGTYIKSSLESHAEAGDRSNDAQRVDGKQLRAKVIGEGANLAVTQRGRIEYSLAGGRCNTDFIDNSAGVDCSDHEVNIKILFGDVERKGGITRAERDELLETMTDEVAQLVLRDNYLQTQALSVTQQLGARLSDRIARMMRKLEKSGQIDRRLEALPDDDALVERQRLGVGFTRPELCVLMAHSKIDLYKQLLASELPDDALLEQDLIDYFPSALRDRFRSAIEQHRLRRELIATVLANDLVNRVGMLFVHEMDDSTGASAARTAVTYVAAREILRARELWRLIEALDNHVPANLQGEMLTECGRVVENLTGWLLREHGPGDLHEHIGAYRSGIQTLSASLASVTTELERKRVEERVRNYTSAGVPAEVAERVASLRLLRPACDVVRVSQLSGVGLIEAGKVYFEAGHYFGFRWLRASAQELPSQRYWDRQAIAALVDDLYASQRSLTLSVLRHAYSKKPDSTAAMLEAWAHERRHTMARVSQLLSELQATATLDLAKLTVANRQIKSLLAGNNNTAMAATVGAP